MRKPKIIVISVFNNKKLYKQMIDSILNIKDDIYVEFFECDNTNKRFSSAAQAYNFAIEQITNNSHNTDDDILIFTHQDVVYYNDSIKMLYELCLKEKETLFGAAGVTVPKFNLKEMKNNAEFISTLVNLRTIKKGETKEVFNIDELMMAGTIKLFKNISFDEDTFDGWHFYAVDFCLQCYLKGIKVKVYGSDIQHFSDGVVDDEFRKYERRLVKKYRKNFSFINYTCGSVYTNPIISYLRKMVRKVRYPNKEEINK